MNSQLQTRVRRIAARVPASSAGGVLLMLLGAAVVMAVMGPYGPYLVAYVSVFVLAAVALNVIVGWAGMISAGHGGLLAIGAYTYALVENHSGSFWLALAATLLVGAVVGILLALPTLRTSGLFYAIITLAFGVVVGQLIIVFDGLTGGSNGLAVSRPEILGLSLADDQTLAWFALGVAGVGVLLTGVVRQSTLGRRIVTVKDSEAAARSLGLDPRRYKVSAMVLSAVMVSVAGAVYGILVGYLSPGDFGVDLSILLLAMVVVGGTRFVFGPVVGAVLLAGVSQSWAALAEFDALFFGVILTLSTVLLGSGGITGGAAAAFQRLRRGSSRVGGLAKGSVPDTPTRPDQLPTADGTATGRTGVPEADTPLSARPVILSTRGLSVEFGGVHALTDVDLTVRYRDLLGVIGPNGAGKSTLFNCVSGFVRPTAGTVEIHGADVTETSAYRRAALGLGRTFQELEMIDELTVRESLLVAGGAPGPRGGAPLADGMRIDEVVELLGLGPVLDQRPTDLSYGMRKTASLARALTANPSVLLLDEPAAGLTDNEADAMASMLRELYETSELTLVVVEHNMTFLRRLVDSVALMRQGRLVTRVPVSQLDTDSSVREAYL